MARLADLPERVGWLVEAGGRELALVRIGERVHALDNDCPHRGAALAFGEVRGELLHCPLHAWAFDVVTGACPEFPGVTVATYPVQVESGGVYVEL